MANGNFDPADVLAICNAANAVAGTWGNGIPYLGGEPAAFMTFAKLCHDRQWSARVAREVWESARPIVEKVTEDDIPF